MPILPINNSVQFSYFESKGTTKGYHTTWICCRLERKKKLNTTNLTPSSLLVMKFSIASTASRKAAVLHALPSVSLFDS